MRQLTAFTKKELMQAVRSGRILILSILFCLFGIMNPAIAKLTPRMLEFLAEDMAESGITVGTVAVDALTSWTQFFKNMPILLIVFIIMFSNHLTEEYQKGTLINVLTKGLKQRSILISKMGVAVSVWTAGYFISFLITYGYNAYFWDNSAARHLTFSVFIFYLEGVWLITAIYLASAFFRSSSAVILTVGGMFCASYFIGFLPKLKEYVPTDLMNAGELILGKAEIEIYLAPLLVTVVLILLNIVIYARSDFLHLCQ